MEPLTAITNLVNQALRMFAARNPVKFKLPGSSGQLKSFIVPIGLILLAVGIFYEHK